MDEEWASRFVRIGFRQQKILSVLLDTHHTHTHRTRKQKTLSEKPGKIKKSNISEFHGRAETDLFHHLLIISNLSGSP